MLRRIKSGLKRALFSMPKPIAVFLAKVGAGLELWGAVQVHYCRLGCPRQVLSGPFQGMSWEPADAGGAWLSKIIGTYEMELHPALNFLATVSFDALADIGCADGYYVIGLARLFQFKKIYAYDTDVYALRCLKRNAFKNQLQTEIQTRGNCTAELLGLDLKKHCRALVICDCEGAELEILNPDVCPSLRAATILVEVHDFPPPGSLGASLRERFDGSHSIKSFQSRARLWEDVPSEATILGKEWTLALNEERKTRMEWLLLQPRASGIRLGLM